MRLHGSRGVKYAQMGGGPPRARAYGPCLAPVRARASRPRRRAPGWATLGLSSAQPGAPAWGCGGLHAPRSPAPWGMATPLPGAAWARWRLDGDRWPME
jgi:hypothetical protein